MKHSAPVQMLPFFQGAGLRRGMLYGGILLGALLAFEVFNFSTTDFALRDILGDMRYGGLRWSTILALAFCGIDFAGIARLFTPENDPNEPAEVWYLFGAWLLAATMNAALTWWGVSIAIINHTSEGGVLVGKSAMTSFVPIIVAVMVWLIRVLIIGTFAIAGDKLFSLASERPYRQRTQHSVMQTNRAATPVYVRPAPKPLSSASCERSSQREPSYHPIGLSAQAPTHTQSNRRQ